MWRLPSSTVAHLAAILASCSNRIRRAGARPATSDRNGYIRWHKHKLFVTSALSEEIVELERIGETTWQIRFLDLVIAGLDERKIDRGIVMKRKPQPATV